MHLLVELFIEFAKNKNISDSTFIVGGSVRDILLDKEIKDLDIVVKGDAVDIAREFANEINASFVLLYNETARVVKKSKHSLFLDISAMRGDSIYTDLAARDITINAMAMPIKDSNKFSVTSNKPKDKNSLLVTRYSLLHVIDPFGGMHDLSHGIIRMVSEKNLIEDPLRLLRVYRFAATLNFSIEKNTLSAVKKLSSLITSVAAERVAEELRYIIKLDDSYKTIKLIADDGLLPRIFSELRWPEELKEHLMLYESTEDVLNNLSRYFPDYSKPMQEYFKTDYKKICLRFSTLFHNHNDNHNAAKHSAIRLRMSNKEVDFISKIALNSQKILKLYKKDKDKQDKTTAIKFLKEFQDDIYPLLIISVAQELLTQPLSYPIRRFCHKLLMLYHGEFMQRMSLLPIITGDDLIEIFYLKPSPLFKEILITIEDMVLEGRIDSKENALRAAKDMVTAQK